MIKVHGSVIIEQDVTFAIVVVKPHVTQYTARAVSFRNEIAPFFRNMPIVLMSQDRTAIRATMAERTSSIF